MNAKSAERSRAKRALKQGTYTTPPSLDQLAWATRSVSFLHARGIGAHHAHLHMLSLIRMQAAMQAPPARPAVLAHLVLHPTFLLVLVPTATPCIRLRRHRRVVPGHRQSAPLWMPLCPTTAATPAPPARPAPSAPSPLRRLSLFVLVAVAATDARLPRPCGHRRSGPPTRMALCTGREVRHLVERWRSAQPIPSHRGRGTCLTLQLWWSPRAHRCRDGCGRGVYRDWLAWDRYALCWDPTRPSAIRPGLTA